jgi:hypothetical protein
MDQMQVLDHSIFKFIWVVCVVEALPHGAVRAAARNPRGRLQLPGPVRRYAMVVRRRNVGKGLISCQLVRDAFLVIEVQDINPDGRRWKNGRTRVRKFLSLHAYQLGHPLF